MEGGTVQMKEGQELTSERDLTTPSWSLSHRHYSFKYTQDRHVYRCVLKLQSTGLSFTQKRVLSFETPVVLLQECVDPS